MKKQYMVTVCIASLLVVTTGCSYSTVINQAEPTNATEDTVETINVVTGSAITEKTVDETLYNTVVDGIYTSENGEIHMQVPQGWKTMENNGSILIVPDTEGSVADNLHVQIANKDENFASYTEATFQKSFEEKFGEISFEKFENTTMIGLPTIKMVYKITQNDVETTEYQYMLDGSQTIIITYTDVDDLLTEEELEICINSIQVLK